MDTKPLTDHELIMAFCKKPTADSKTYIAFFTNEDHDILEASTKAEATRIAREYAVRILGTDLAVIYLQEDN
jgi:hypothetical protein